MLYHLAFILLFTYATSLPISYDPHSLHYAVEHNDIRSANLMLQNATLENFLVKSASAYANAMNISETDIYLRNMCREHYYILLNLDLNYEMLFAARLGYHDMVKILIDAGASVNYVDYHGRSLLHHTIYENDLELTKIAIKYGADVNLIDYNKYSLLMRAAYEGRKEIADQLIINGADVNYIDQYNQSALTCANDAGLGNYEMIDLLVRNGANITQFLDEINKIKDERVRDQSLYQMTLHVAKINKVFKRYTIQWAVENDDDYLIDLIYCLC